MDEDEKIGLVLARASELHSKISDAIERGGGEGDGPEGGEEDEEECLFGIRDALESLEKQLASLQALHQQQRYEREAALAQIDRSRRKLLSKLKECKGDELEVIHEAAAFASETAEHDDSFLLPPYPTHLPDLFVLNDLYPTSQSSLKSKPSENCKHMNQSQNKPRGMRLVLGLAAKSAIAFVGIVSVLNLAGLGPEIRKKKFKLNLLGLLPKPAKEKEQPMQCPPGKVLLIEDGKARCIVKERIEIPFGADAGNPNIPIGFG
ncbi:Plastid division protein PDV2 [Apostasia shenzhenica]|uniref:Plastid division protein PDV2 n=1 Tax=Apostasia shenzhenica TaxID=1088818 RepID=A0A2I0BDS8_9ASPA|nr:Plastid division protein PDV2 [Apostasia shenzhenica]